MHEKYEMWKEVKQVTFSPLLHVSLLTQKEVGKEEKVFLIISLFYSDLSRVKVRTKFPFHCVRTAAIWFCSWKRCIISFGSTRCSRRDVGSLELVSFYGVTVPARVRWVIQSERTVVTNVRSRIVACYICWMSWTSWGNPSVKECSFPSSRRTVAWGSCSW